MAVVGVTNPTLLDQIKRTDPDGSIADVGEALQQSNPVLMDATMMEGNLPTGHRITIRDGLPSVGYRLLNQGITSSKSTTIQVDESAALLEGRSEVDVELARLNGNDAAFRASEDVAFLQAMNHQAMSTLFYGNTKTDPEQFHGFTPRYDSLTGGNNDNIIDFDAITGDAGSGADSNSIWMISWSPQTCFMIYPKGTVGGLDRRDLGIDYVNDGTAGQDFLAYRTHWTWRLGLAIKDWRYVVRFGGIDATDFVATETSLITGMVQMYNRMRDFNTGRTVIYCNRTVLEFIDLQVINKTNMYFTPVEWHGRQISGFRGIPIVVNDGLLATESPIAA